jgi:hypothetical protein
MTISQDCSKSAHKTVENNIWTHLGHRTCCWNRFNPRAFVKWGFQFFSTSDQISLKKFLLRGIFGVLKKKRDPRFSMANPPIHGSNPCPNRRLSDLSLHLLQLQLRLAKTLRLGNRQKLAASDSQLMDINTSSTAQGGGGSFKNRKPKKERLVVVNPGWQSESTDGLKGD